MNTIKVNIKEIVRTNLINESDRRKHILNSFQKIKDLKNEQLLEGYISTSNKLISEGYGFHEIENLINEIENPLNMLDGKVDWGGMFKESLYSSAKEYIIKWLLNAVGMGPQWSTTMAQALADLNPLDLLKPFKNEQNCIQYMPNICDTVLEVLVRYLGSSATGTNRTDYNWSGMGSVGVGNIFGEAIRESNIGESISNKLCKVIH
jgi:hypothetical protein